MWTIPANAGSVQSAGYVEYVDCISAKGYTTITDECINTKSTLIYSGSTC